MSDPVLPPGERAAALRREFDASFAAPPPGAPPPREALVTLRAGGFTWAVRLSEVAAVHADLPVTPLPSASAGFLGIAAPAGAPVGVWDLGVALGGAPCAAPRWILVAAGGEAALAFDALEGHVAAEQGGIVRDAGGGGHPLAAGVVRDGGGPVTVLALRAVVDRLVERRDPGAPGQGRER